MFENNFYRYRPKVCPEIGKIMKEPNMSFFIWRYNLTQTYHTNFEFAGRQSWFLSSTLRY